MTNTESPTTYELPHAHDNRCWWNHEQARWVCPTGAMATDPDRVVDVRDMLVVHTALLREFRLAPLAIRAATGNRRRAGHVARHLLLLCDLLHHHHSGEDTLLWPVLRERVPGGAPVFTAVDAQHAQLDASVLGVREHLTGWIADPEGPGTKDRLVADLTRLHTELRDHLDLEERAVLPLAALSVTPAEWHAVGEAAVASMPKSVLPLLFGMFAYEGDPAVLRDMLQSAPAVPRALLPRIAPRVYARRARRVHGTATP